MRRHYPAICFVLVLSAGCAASRSSEGSQHPAPRTAATSNPRSVARDLYIHLHELMDRNELDSIVNLFAEDAIYRDRTFDFEVHGRAAVREIFRATINGIADRKLTVRRMLNSGDTLVTEWVMSGRFAAPLMGVQPDGDSITIEGVSIGVVSDRRIIEQTDYLDRVSLEKRLGIYQAKVSRIAAPRRPVQ
jgi:steroid delta-isomerase-like uncharacterized protein